jgi:hypothetical protein
LHRRLSKALAPIVGALLVVGRDPRIEVKLQGVDGVVDLLEEGDAVELVQQRLVEPLTNAVGLAAFDLGKRVVEVLDSEVEFILVAIMGTASRR